MVGDILQPTHLLFVLVVALLVLGPKRLPEVARTLGKGIRDFRGAISGDNDNDHPSFLGQDHSSPASTTPEVHEEPPAAATATTPAESSVPTDAPAPTEPPVAPPVTPATTTPDPAPAADPQPVVPALGTQPVTPATTAPDPDDKPSQAPDGDDAPATAVHPAGARAEQHD
jgi:TatA/E family protein of Tat protein translocase